MDVQLYVYDLSKGIARQFSRQFLGIQIDAVYHTSLVFGGVEYFFGQGVHTTIPGRTHHGAPMEIVAMGKTSLPVDVIAEYLESLKAIYTAESYDLFAHNCNNFTNDFATFLVGKGIPAHITNLPRQVLDTPFGQMLRPQIDQAMRSMTQAPPPPQAAVPQPPARTASSQAKTPQKAADVGRVHQITTLSNMERLLRQASDSCAVVFFTSSTCAPCKVVYPAFDDLAAEAGAKATFIKIDINNAYEIASRYQVRATPTFLTFLKGKKNDEWTGANERELRNKVDLLMQSAYPPHPHTKLKLAFQKGSLRPITYTKLPPLEKMLGKMGPAQNNPTVLSVAKFIDARSKEGAREAPLPNLSNFATFLRRCPSMLSEDTLFAAYDLLRTALIDPRVSAFFIEDDFDTVASLLTHVNDLNECPHNLRLVSLHLAANLFTSPLDFSQILGRTTLVSALTGTVSKSLLDTKHSTVRLAAASLAFNLATANHRVRMEDKREALPDGEQVELAASMLEAISTEEDSKEVVKALATALGFLVYCAPINGEVLDLCKSMDANGIITAKESFTDSDRTVTELGRELFGRHG